MQAMLPRILVTLTISTVSSRAGPWNPYRGALPTRPREGRLCATRPRVAAWGL